MTIKKLGLVFCASDKSGWKQHSFMTPVPLLHHSGIIRVYGGMQDAKGVSRLGYVDLDPQDPRRVLAVSKEPVVDTGKHGDFDDSGIILGCLLRTENFLRMYYVGFSHPSGVKFQALSGIAESKDEGDTFERFSDKPVIGELTPGSPLIAIHTVIKRSDVYDAWYAIGTGWLTLGEDSYPRYEIGYTRSYDGLTFEIGKSCLKPEGEEYRIGRPTVFKIRDCYYMFYTSDTLSKVYRCGLAKSEKGEYWERTKHPFIFPEGNDSWEGKEVCYPSLPLTVMGRTYIFYNGNDKGRTGFGVAEINLEDVES